MVLTCEGVDADGGAHFLKLDPELRVLADLLFVLAGKRLQVGLECFQLFGHLAKKKKLLSKQTLSWSKTLLVPKKAAVNH